MPLYFSQVNFYIVHNYIGLSDFCNGQIQSVVGVKAIEYLNSNNPLPDLILTDLIMPEMDGFELCLKRSNMSNVHPITTENQLYSINFSLRSPKPDKLLDRISIVLIRHVIKKFTTKVMLIYNV